jgi:hypothetical protein
LRKSGPTVLEEVTFQLDEIWELDENNGTCSFIRKRWQKRSIISAGERKTIFHLEAPPSSSEYDSYRPPPNSLFCLALFYQMME